MHIVVHDYSGHPFQLQLSRELARRGHRVRHQYCVSYATGKGAVTETPDDPATFSIEPVAMSGKFARYSPAKRILQEAQYGVTLARMLRAQRPDVVVMCNIPLIAHTVAASYAARAGIPMVFWQQDVYSHAINTAARQRLGRVLGGAVGAVATSFERWIARRSREVVPISDDFRGVLRAWGVPEEKVTVIPNWAALDEMPVREKDNPWSRAHDLAHREVVAYSGTLGLKHDPQVLAKMASALRQERPEARVVVVSEGQGRDWLEAEKRRAGLDNLILLDYQPYESLPDVLATADVLVTVLEPDASRYSVPSKVLNYLCAARAVLGIMPADNNAAVTLTSSGAGVVVPPGDDRSAVAEALRLLSDGERRKAMGFAGRRHADANFDIVQIGKQFEAILMRAEAGGAPAGVGASASDPLATSQSPAWRFGQ